MLENVLKQRYLAVITAIVSLIFLYFYTQPAFATSETINFQGKIVRNDAGYEGLNVVPGSPACVIAGNSNDTCDFRVKYYNASGGGTLLGTEVFSNIEIGYFDGVFNLVLGSGSYTGGSESSFRNVFLNNSSVFIEVDFAPNGSTYTETFLASGGLRMGVRAAAYAISSSGANKQFQFDLSNDATGYSNINEGQVFFDGDDNVLRLYDGTQWLAVQAYVGNLPSLWTLNEATTPDVISSYTGLDVAFGGDDSTAPFFYDVSDQYLTLTNGNTGDSFRVNDQISDTSPFIIDDVGNVGIGTETPDGKLEVNGGRTILKANGDEYTVSIGRTDGAGEYWIGVDASATPSLKFKNTSGVDRLVIADSGLMTQTSSNSIESGIILKRPLTNSTHIQWQLFGQTNNKDFWITAQDGVTTRNYIKFYWDSQTTNFDAGTVGIGVATTDAFLDIKAATTTSAQLNLTTSAGVNPSTPVSGDMWWNGTNLYFYDGSSNVDILVGTGGTGTSLFTDGGAVTYLDSLTDDFALGGTDNTAPLFFDEGSELLTLTNTTAGLSFVVNDQASDTTPFVIDANGNVGIGTTTPGAKLDIAGSSSTISNSAGDITIDSNSGNISFAGDSLTNVLNATFSGDVNVNGGQLKVGNFASNPTSIGEGSMVYNSTDKKLYYYKDTGWSEVGKVYTGTANQTMRHDGTDWIATSALQNDGTNITATGQVRVGNYGSKPTGIGAGALVYDTTMGSLFVYDGADWKAISTSQFQTTTGVIASGDSLDMTHNFNSTNVVASAWVKVGSQWKIATEKWNAIDHDMADEFERSLLQSRTEINANSVRLKESTNFGTGKDGSISTTAATTLDVTNLIAGRTCTQGGDAVNYSVTALTASSATLTTTPSAGCLAIGDEVLLINLQGVTTAMVNVGNNETFRVQSISTNTVNFTSSKTKFYGDGVSNDSNIGTATTNQRVMLQRIPQYKDVTVTTATGRLLPSAWNNVKGGVLFFRATGTVTVGSGSYIHANSKGFSGGVARVGGTNVYYGGGGGESYCGLGGAGATSGNGASGSAGGGAAGVTGTTGGTGYCGGGGGSHWGSGYGVGSASSGGSGGGGAGQAGGAGAGYGTPGYNGGGSLTAGTNLSAPGIVGGGGGGTYGDSDLTRLMLGSGGGAGGVYNPAGNYAGAGGVGGGIIYLAVNTLSVSGNIQSAGAAGGNYGSCAAGYYIGGSGGGAGGAIKIVGSSINIGASLLSVPGGSGSTECINGTTSAGYRGGAGGSGRIAIRYTSTYTGTPAQTADTATLAYYPYGIYTSNVEKLPNSGSLGTLKWNKNTTPNTNVNFQTRTGNTPDPTGVAWFKYNNTVPSISDSYCNDGRLCLGTNGTGDDNEVIPGTVLLDAGVYKMWYTGNDGTNSRIYYATSSDGLKWVKYDNSTPAASDTTSTNGRVPLGTNTTGDDATVYAPSVIKDGSTYKMWYAGSDGANVRIYYATSPDGLTWTKNSNAIPANSDTTGTLGRIPLANTAGRGDTNHVHAPSVLKDGSTYKIWYSGTDASSQIRIYYATSSDGLTWTKNDNTIPSVSDTTSTNGRIPFGNSTRADSAGSAHATVILDNGVYKAWYTGVSASSYVTLYATSSDGLTWTKYDNSVPEVSNISGHNGTIPLGTEGDAGYLAFRTVFSDTDSTGNQIYRMYYGARANSGDTFKGYYAYSYPDNSSWESWKPNTATTNYLSVQNANTHGDFTASGALISEGDITRSNVYMFEDELETNQANITKVSASGSGNYAETTISSLDLSTYNYLTFWINASQSGNTVSVGIGETVATQHVEMVTIDSQSNWQKVYWDISDIPSSLRDSITKLRVTSLASSNVMYIDNFAAETIMNDKDGVELSSANNEYIQYRAIMTTTNTAYRPILYNVELSWSNGYKVELTDANTVKVFNYTGISQELKLSVTTGGGQAASGSGWTETGGNIYRATGNVGIGDSTPDTTMKVVGSLCVKADANDCAGNTAGTIYANNLSIQSADLAEMYKIEDQTIEQGDLVSLSKSNTSEIEKSDIENSGNLMGVISTAPALVMNDAQKVNHRAVALVGRVPIKVMRGAINISEGDSLGVSPVEGFGSKINQPGFSVARAIESTTIWSEQECGTVDGLDKIKWPKDKGANETKPCFRVPVSSFAKEIREQIVHRYSVTLDDYIYVGKIMGYVSVQWYQPEWMTEGISELVNQYNNGGIGGDWEVDGDRLMTSKDVLANSFSSNYGSFNVLAGSILNIGEDKFTVDTGGNIGVAGDMLISGNIQGADGNVSVLLGDSNGEKAFEIRNSDGNIVFEVDSKGEVGGTGVYKTGWLRVEGSSHIDVNHNFGKVPSDISIVISKNIDGTGFSTKGLGSDYYYESTNDNSLRIFNKTGEDVFVKLTVQR